MHHAQNQHKEISLRLKLLILVFVSVFALALVGFGGWMGVSRVREALVAISENKLPASIQLGNIRGHIAVHLQSSQDVSTRE